ncbi:hypothetical protein AAEX28_15355 [Lentisphaerota bacterium WC36G]|nr:hypothetical protein LJT99_02120 [Lentisphaerae bacterium WC36]
MKRFLDIFVMLFMIALFPGCMSINENDSDYTVDRKRDFNDIFTYGIGAGIKGQAGPFYAVIPVFETLRGNKKVQANFYSEKCVYNPIAWARNKQYQSTGMFFYYPTADNQFVTSYYTQFEIGVGFILPLIPYLGFNPGELLDWGLGYWGIDIYDDDIGLAPTFEEDLLVLNKFFAEHDGNLSSTNEEQTVICHEYERCRVYNFKNYSLAVFPLYWQKYGIYDFVLSINSDNYKKQGFLISFKQDNCSNFLRFYKTHPLIGFNNYFLGEKYCEMIALTKNWNYLEKITGTKEGEFFNNNEFTTIDNKNSKELVRYRFMGFIEKKNGTNKVFKNRDYFYNPDRGFEYGELIDSKSIKIKLPINHKLKLNKTK